MGKPSAQKISCIPEVYEANCIKQGDWCVLCCDGIFDVMSNAEIVSFIGACLEKNDADLGDVCAELLRQCLGKKSRDNMTAMIIQFGDGSASAEMPDEIQNYCNLPSGEHEPKAIAASSYKQGIRLQRPAYRKFLTSKGFGNIVQPCKACWRWHEKMALCPFSDHKICQRLDRKMTPCHLRW